MFTASSRDRVMDVDSASPVRLVGRESAVAFGGRRFSLGAAYFRPTRVETADGVSVPMIDHLMVVRLAVAAVVLLAFSWRLLSD